MYELSATIQKEVVKKKRSPARFIAVQAGAPLSTTLYWASSNTTWNGQAYDGIIVSTSKRSGGTINIGENIPSQQSFSFTIADVDGYYSSQPAATFLGRTITLYETFTGINEAVSFAFNIRKVSATKRGELTFECTDLFTIQNYPDIPRLKITEDLFPHADQSLYGTNVPVWYGDKKAPIILIDKGDPDTVAPAWFLIGAGNISVTSALQRERLLTSGATHDYITSAWSSTSGTLTLLKIINPEQIYSSDGSITEFIVHGTRTDIPLSYLAATSGYYSPANIFLDMYTNPYYGLARSSGELDTAYFTSAAIAMEHGGTTPIRFNCRLTSEMDFKSLFSNLLFSCHSWITVNDQIRLFHNPNTSATSAFDETNIIQTNNGDQSFSLQTRDMSRVFNSVSVEYEDKNTWSSEITANPGPSIVTRKFSVTSGGAATSALGIQDQGIIHSYFIGDSQVADRAGYLHIEELSNAVQEVSFTTHLPGKAISVLDLVPVSWSKYGLDNQLVRVTGIENDEHSYTITGYTSVVKTVPNGSLVTLNTNAKPRPGSVSITSSFGSFSQITWAWNMLSDFSISRYHFQVSSAASFATQFIDATTYGNQFTFVGTVGKNYYFRIKAVDVFSQESSSWTSSGPVYAAEVSASDLSVAYIKETYIDMGAVASPYIAAGNAWIQGTLKVGSGDGPSSAGAIQSYNYNGTDTGWQIAHDGTINIFGNPNITNNSYTFKSRGINVNGDMLFLGNVTGETSGDTKVLGWWPGDSTAGADLSTLSQALDGSSLVMDLYSATDGSIQATSTRIPCKPSTDYRVSVKLRNGSGGGTIGTYIRLYGITTSGDSTKYGIAPGAATYVEAADWSLTSPSSPDWENRAVNSTGIEEATTFTTPANATYFSVVIYNWNTGTDTLEHLYVDYCIVEDLSLATSFDSIVGSTKPEDNATVGAIWGSNITGQPSAIYNIFYQSSAPTAEQTGDYWIDSDDNKIYRWVGSWVLIQDADIAAALSSAATAQATADGKIVTFFQTSAPTALGSGDLWFDTDDNYKPYRWSGSAWQAAPYDVADWTKVFGTGKPDDYATVGASAGTNLFDSGGSTISYLTSTQITATSISSPKIVGNSGRFYGVITVGPTISTSQGITISSAGIWHGSTYNHSNSKFGVSSAGDAYFKGDITGAAGTFLGNINSVGTSGYITVEPNSGANLFTVYGKINGAYRELFGVVEDVTSSFAARVNFQGAQKYGILALSGQDGWAAYCIGTSANTGGVKGLSTKSGSIGVIGNAILWDFYAQGTGTYGPFTGSHEVTFETSSSNSSADFGKIYSSTGNAKKRYIDGTSSLYLGTTFISVRKTTTSCDNSIFGVLTNIHDYLPKDHWYELSSGEKFGIVNALGEGRIIVTNINGEINSGDLITSSNIPGYGQKQDDDLVRSYTVGKATEDVDWDSITDTITYNGTDYKYYLIACVYMCG